MRSERAARLFLFVIVAGIPLAVGVARRTSATGPTPPIEIHGVMPESGGWIPDVIRVPPGEPVSLRLTSDDVMHGFAIAGIDLPALDVRPGEVVETAITFAAPGTYVFYCTRWCGPNHWRMRGTIEVYGEIDGEAVATAAPEPPLYLRLGLDLDAPHEAEIVPGSPPSANRGKALGVQLPDAYLSRSDYLRRAPVDMWWDLRVDSVTAGLTDLEVWDLVALVWERNTTPELLDEGRELYAQNCAACHGEQGRGDGVMASALSADSTAGFGHATTAPADFTDPVRMLGASPALLQGKIVRGGMGTGMPYWGPVFSDEQIRTLADYLYTFVYSVEGPASD